MGWGRALRTRRLHDTGILPPLCNFPQSRPCYQNKYTDAQDGQILEKHVQDVRQSPFSSLLSNSCSLSQYPQKILNKLEVLGDHTWSQCRWWDTLCALIWYATNSAFQLSAHSLNARNRMQSSTNHSVWTLESCFEREMVVNEQLIYQFRNLLHVGQWKKVKMQNCPDSTIQLTLLYIESEWCCTLFPEPS